MINPNLKGTIYYGTDINYICDLDKNGLLKPRIRNEQYISVSISGYVAQVQCNHKELEELARVFSDELHVAEYKDKKLSYKDGYTNSITCLHGFGPNPNPYFPGFYGLTKNNKTKDKVTAVISKDALVDLVYPDKSSGFEYWSLALHGFIKTINQDLILGWIVHEEKANELRDMMDKKIIKEREIWVVEDFEKAEFDFLHKSKYGVCPDNINNYIEGLKSKNIDTQTTCYEHLKNIIFHVTADTIDWNDDFLVLSDEISTWLEYNSEYLKWNKEEWCYNLKD